MGAVFPGHGWRLVLVTVFRSMLFQASLASEQGAKLFVVLIFVEITSELSLEYPKSRLISGF